MWNEIFVPHVSRLYFFLSFFLVKMHENVTPPIIFQPQLRPRVHNDLHHQPASVAKENQAGGDVTE